MPTGDPPYPFFPEAGDAAAECPRCAELREAKVSLEERTAQVEALAAKLGEAQVRVNDALDAEAESRREAVALSARLAASEARASSLEREIERRERIVERSRVLSAARRLGRALRAFRGEMGR